MNFQRGDIVHVKEGLTSADSTSNWAFIDEMQVYCGRNYEVAKVYADGTIRLKEIEGSILLPCYWVSEWLEPISLNPDFESLDFSSIGELI